MTSVEGGTERGTATDGTREQVVAELEVEDDLLLKPLISRMGEVADLLDQGKEVDVQYVSRGFALWARYGAEIHQPRVQRVLGLIASTLVTGPRAVAEGSRRLRRGEKKRAAAAQATQQETLLRDYQSIVHNQSLSEPRSGELGMLRELYSQSGFGARERLASVLKAFVLSEESWASFEVEFVRGALSSGASPELAAHLREGLDALRAARSRLEPEVQQYLAEPIPVGGVPPAAPPVAAVAAPNPQLRPPSRGKPLVGT